MYPWAFIFSIHSKKLFICIFVNSISSIFSLSDTLKWLNIPNISINDDLTDENYPVAPTTVITDVQTKGESIYNDDSKYLDYSITLTPQTISKIKQVNKTQKNYLNYTGTAKKDTGNTKRSIYRSSLLDSLGSNVVTTRYTRAIGCNNQEGNNCVTASMLVKDACITSYETLRK